MTRRLLLLLTFASLLCHAIVAQGAWAAVGVSEQAQHALLHWQGSAHHHHEHSHAPAAGAGDKHVHTHYHQDDSPSSLKHVNADGALYAAALLGVLDLSVASLPRADLVAGSALEPAAPFLERLKRPPRLLT